VGYTVGVVQESTYRLEADWGISHLRLSGTQEKSRLQNLYGHRDRSSETPRRILVSRKVLSLHPDVIDPTQSPPENVRQLEPRRFT